MSSLRVGWIGLGAMGSGMVKALIREGFGVKAFDVYPPSLQAAVSTGAVGCSSPSEAATNVDVLSLMVVNAAQIEELLFGDAAIVSSLAPQTVILIFSTVPPSYLVCLRQKLADLRKGIEVCDSPVSGGSTRAEQGQLAIMSSGSPGAIQRALPVLSSLAQGPAGKLSVVGETAGAASDFKLINQVLCIVQIALASEAMAFGAKLGLNPRMLLNIITKASGNSFMFGHRVPWQLRHDGIPKSAMTIASKDIGIVMDEARLSGFPAPLCAQTEQLFACAIGAGLAKEDDGLVIKWFRQFGVDVQEQGTEEEEAEKAKELEIKPSTPPASVVFYGLGAMGLPMALTLHQAGFKVFGHDISAQAMERFVSGGGTPYNVGVSHDAAILMPNTAEQAEAILFGSTGGDDGLVQSLNDNAVIVLTSTVAPSAACRIQDKLSQLERGLQLVDAPVSGGPARSATGSLTVMASGEPASLSKASPLLQALSITSSDSGGSLHFIPGGVGSAEKVKIVNNLLAGVQLAVAAEGFAFAKMKKMDLEKVFGILSSGAAYSYVMVDRWPRMQMAQPPVFSAVETLVKDLGIALAEGKALGIPLWLTAAAHQQFVATATSGWAHEDDSCIGRLWERYGIRIRAD